jgi:hypothetical protein
MHELKLDSVLPYKIILMISLHTALTHEVWFLERISIMKNKAHDAFLNKERKGQLQ